MTDDVVGDAVHDAGDVFPELREPLCVDDAHQDSVALQIFQHACGEGRLHTVRAMVEGGVVTGDALHAHDDFAFRMACGRDSWHVAQYLVSLGGVDVHANCDGAFRSACDEGRLDMAQWLVEAAGGTPFARYVAADTLESACRNRHADLFVWLQAMWGLDAVHGVFLRACEHTYLEEVQWLYTFVRFTDKNEHLIAHQAVKNACAAGKVDVLQWLCTLPAMRLVVEFGRADLLTECCERMCQQLATVRNQWWMACQTRTVAVITWLLAWGTGEWPDSVPLQLRHAFTSWQRRWTWMAIVVHARRTHTQVT